MHPPAAASLALVALASFSLGFLVATERPAPALGSPFARSLALSTASQPRVMYTADNSEGPIERYDVRAPWKPVPTDALKGMKVMIVGWWDEPKEPLASMAKEFEKLGGQVSMFGSISRSKNGSIAADSLSKLLQGQDIVIWWNWGHSVSPQVAGEVRKRYPFPNQTWVLHDWDEPYQMIMGGYAQLRKHLWDVVFASATAVLDPFRFAGAIETHAFVPTIDADHYPDWTLEYAVDAAFVATRHYAEPGHLANRSAILEALSAAADRGELTLGVWGFPQLKPAAPNYYRGEIPYEINRKVWSSAKISLDVHAVPGYGGWYVNHRATEILGSGGLLLVDDSAEGPLRDGEDCVILRDLAPDAIVARIKEILKDYKKYNLSCAGECGEKGAEERIGVGGFLLIDFVTCLVMINSRPAR